MATSSPIPDPSISALADFEDDHPQARAALGLQQIRFESALSSRSAEHPDRRPCPPWCVVGREGYAHEVEPARVTTATHHTDIIPVLASCYRGSTVRFGTDEELGAVRGATWQFELEQVGQAPPVINVALRDHDRDERARCRTVMTLRVADARDVARVLDHLVHTATEVIPVPEKEETPTCATRPSQYDIDQLRDLLDLLGNFSSNDQRARYLLNSDWMRDRDAARVDGRVSVDSVTSS